MSLLLPLICITKIFFKGPCLLSALIWLVMTLIVNIYMSVLPNRTVDNDLPVVFYIIIVLYTMLPLSVLWSLFFGFLSTLLQMLLAGIFTSENKENLVFQVRNCTVFVLITGLSHPFLGMGPGPLELGKLAAFRLKLGKSILSICMKLTLLD